MPVVRVNGIDVRYETFGPSGGTPLVLTHGFAGPLDDWLPELIPLTQRRRLVLYDVRGHGRTTAPAEPEVYSLPLFASDLAGLLAALGIRRAHVGGISMGGMITAQFAVDYPDFCASVILSDTTCGNGLDPGPAGEWERKVRTGIAAAGYIATRFGLEETVRLQHEYDRANNPHLAESPYRPEDDFQRIKLMTVQGFAGAAAAIANRPDLTSRIPAIRAPTLIMVGEWDDFYPCALRDHALIPGSRLVVRQRCGHGSRWRLETWISEIEAFLDDVEAGRPVAGQRTV